MQFNQQLWKWLFASVFLLLIVQLGYEVRQSDFQLIVSWFGGAFMLYVFILRSQLTQQQLNFWLAIAIFARFLLLFSIPNLSDDVYRFIWDGRLWLNGINPFEQLPSYYIEKQIELTGITPKLYERLNSPNYFTIYPPIAQLTFFSSCWLFPTSIWGSTIVMKLFLFAFEIGNLFLLLRLLKHFQLPEQNALIYLLNPLIIIEIVGNLHFEGAMIFFLLLSIWILVSPPTALFQRGKVPLAALAMAGSVVSKLLPLLFLPLFLRRLGLKKSLVFYAVTGIAVLALFYPLLGELFLQNFGDSLNLYFQKFEFNASIYYIVRWIGYQYKGWNMIADIGPALAICTLVSVLALTFLEKNPTWKRLPLMMLFVICIYLSFTTTVHPWYIALPLVLCVFTRFRFPVLWSALILLTYINYSTPEYQENLWIVALEYLAVWIYFLWEFFRGK